MDFTNRGNQSSPAAPRPGSSFPATTPEHSKAKAPKSFGGDNKYRFMGASLIVLALLAAAVLGVLFTTSQKSEESLVDTTRLQAVFLTNDQVYFGKITDINQKFLTLGDIYYLQTASTGNNQTNNANNVSLIKLGCELHQPTDRMVINREQVQFWENLKAEGQVAKAVEKYKQDNPNGQTCSTSTGTQSGTSVQGSSATPTPTSNQNTNTSTGANSTNN